MKSEEITKQEKEEESLQSVVTAFSSIYNGQSKLVDYGTIYHTVYMLCRKGMTEQILKRLKTVSKSIFQTFLNNIDNQKCEPSHYVNLFTKIQQSEKMITKILHYIQTNYLKDPKTTIKQILNQLFFAQLCKNKQILNKISELVSKARIKNKQKQIYMLIQAINKLDEKQIFLPQYFSFVFCNTVSNHLLKEFNQNYKNKQFKQFLQQAKQKIQQERIWLKSNFQRNKGKKLVEQLIKKIFDNSFNSLKQQIYNQKANQLFKQASLQFLQLLNEKNQIKQINDYNEWYINQIKKILTKMDKSNNTKFLTQFIKQYENVSQYLSRIKNFNIGYKATFFFEHWINEDKIQFPRRLNIYFQDCFIKNENVNIKQTINNFAILFKFLKEKDYFQKQFRRACALRIIYGSQKRGIQIQNNLINEMANQCGADWVFKLKNLNLATQQTNKLKQFFNPKFKAIVFQDSAWPFQKLQKIPLIRAQLLQLVGKFKQKYQQVYKGRVLQWHPLEGYVILSIKLNNKIQQFKMDIVMATILLNLAELKYKSTIKQIIQLTNLSIQQSLEQFQILEKQNIIKTTNSLKNIQNLTQIIQLNLDYKSKTQNTLIDFTNRYLQQQFVEKHGHEELKNQRKMMVQAFIVKIMKANKQISKQQLNEQITPMIEARGFKFNQKFVDNCFTGLIDKRYIKQFENGKYCYLPS